MVGTLESHSITVNSTLSERRDLPRVLFVVPGDGSGCSMIFVRRQIKALLEAGVTTHEFYLGSRTSARSLLRERRRFRETVRLFSPDLVHAQFGTVTALFTALETSVPVVVTYRGSDLNPCPGISRTRSTLGRVFSQIAALRATAIICVSEQLRRQLWWRRHLAHVVPSGVDTNLFQPRPRDKARSELGWSSEDRIVLFNAGKDPAVKRLALARAAVERAATYCGRVRLIVLDGSVEPDRVPAFLNAADCLLLTSAWEGSPNIVKEALACNLPVVSVEVGDVRELLDGVCPSRLVRPDPDEIARVLVEILLKPSRSNGSVKLQAISCAAVAERVLAVYRSVWNRH